MSRQKSMTPFLISPSIFRPLFFRITEKERIKLRMERKRQKSKHVIFMIACKSLLRLRNLQIPKDSFVITVKANKNQRRNFGFEGFRMYFVYTSSVSDGVRTPEQS